VTANKENLTKSPQMTMPFS